MENNDFNLNNLENSLKRFLDFSAKSFEKNKLLLEQLTALAAKPSKLNNNIEADSKNYPDLEARVKLLEEVVFKKF